MSLKDEIAPEFHATAAKTTIAPMSFAVLGVLVTLMILLLPQHNRLAGHSSSHFVLFSPYWYNAVLPATIVFLLHAYVIVMLASAAREVRKRLRNATDAWRTASPRTVQVKCWSVFRDQRVHWRISLRDEARAAESLALSYTPLLLCGKQREIPEAKCASYDSISNYSLPVEIHL